MIERHTTIYVDRVKPIEFCGKTVLWQMEFNGAFELPFEIEPTDGEHDFNNCKGCMKNLKEFTEDLKVRFEGKGGKEGFPFCCSYHSGLVKVKEFRRELFGNVPEMVARKAIYTNQHFINNHSAKDWYKKATDYFEWMVESFGKMPANCGEPLFLSYYFDRITALLKTRVDIPADKQTRILEYINAYLKPNKKPNTDLNILIATYEKWFKIFPFELNSYFGNLKLHFEKEFPILRGKPEVNIYSGMAKSKMHTKSSLIEALIDLTDNLLKEINGVTLYENGLITDANKIKVELVINSRKLKLKQGYKNNSSNEEQRYRKILKEWFNDEKIFMEEITPLLKPATPDQVETKTTAIGATHREIIIAHNFKVQAGIENEKTPAEWKLERGEKARQGYYTTLKQSGNYKQPTIQELSKVIELLKEFPTAQKMAINKKAELESL